MTTILITGGNGLVGQHATRCLIDSGADVVVAGRSGTAPVGARGVGVNFLDSGAPEALIRKFRPDVLVHLAWETCHGDFWQADINEQWADASACLLDEFLDVGGCRAVFAGSCAEYDWPSLDPDGVCHETGTLLSPATVYGKCKLRTWEMVKGRIAHGASCVWGRLFLLYGAGEHPNRFVSSIIRNILMGREAPMTSGRQIRDLMDTRDAGRAFAELASHGVTGPVNIATGQGITLEAVARRIASLLHRPDLIGLSALDDRSDDPPALLADISRLAYELGFNPTHDLDAGLRHAIEYWRDVAEHS
jgi:nucleoside-diphosphate-sugar epimerase